MYHTLYHSSIKRKYALLQTRRFRWASHYSDGAQSSAQLLVGTPIESRRRSHYHFFYLQVSHTFVEYSDPNELAERQSGIDFTALLKHFQETQKRHHDYRGMQRKRIITASDKIHGLI